MACRHRKTKPRKDYSDVLKKSSLTHDKNREFRKLTFEHIVNLEN
jgi:hypothetical protein